VPPIDWNLVLQSGAGSFFGAIVVYIAGLVVLSFDSKIESFHIVENRKKKWLVKSIGSKPAYLFKIEGDTKFKPRYLSVNESLDLPSGTFGGRVYYKRFKSLPLFRRYIVYGSNPDFLAERGIIKKLRRRGIAGYLMEVCKVKSPRLFIAIHLFLAARIANKKSSFKMTLSLSVNPKDQEQLFLSLHEITESGDSIERVVSRYVSMPHMFSHRLVKGAAPTKLRRKGNEYSFNITRKVLLSTFLYLVSFKGKKDSLSRNAITCPKDFVDSIFYSSRQSIEYTKLMNPLEESDFPEPIVEQKTTSLKQIRIHGTLEISKPVRLTSDPNIGLLFSEDTWNIDASEKHRKFVLVKNDGVVVYQSQKMKRGAKLIADTPKSIRLTKEQASHLRSKIENWKNE